jgi:hypothetical protein
MMWSLRPMEEFWQGHASEVLLDITSTIGYESKV